VAVTKVSAKPAAGPAFLPRPPAPQMAR